MKTEELIANTILEKNIEIDFRGTKIQVPQLTLATLIEVSKEISNFPYLEIDKEEKLISKQIIKSLEIAKDCNNLAKIIAMLMLGSNNFIEEVTETTYEKIFLFIKRKVIKLKTINRLEKLTKQIKENLTFEEISNIFNSIITTLRTDFFLGGIITLNEVNILKRTKI